MPGTPTVSVDGDKAPLAIKATASSEYQDFQTLTESYQLSLQYGDEYMDENPLIGEPGSFRINKAKEVAVPKPVLNISTPFALPPPDSKSAESPVTSKKNKEKSPITPGNKEKKSRRKSKAAGATTTTTPK